MIYTFVTFQSKQADNGFLSTNFATIVRRLQVILPVSVVLTTIFSLVPLGMITAMEETHLFALGAGHFLVLGTAIFFLGMIYIPVLVRPLERDLQVAVKATLSPGASTILKQILDKIIMFRRQLRIQAIGNGITAFLFGAWPFLQSRGSSYWLPIAWISASAAAAMGLHVLLPVTASPADDQGNSTTSSSPKEAKVDPRTELADDSVAAGDKNLLVPSLGPTKKQAHEDA
jgi:hypothetical protein